jgi:succinylglutamate desuccinylase
VEEAVEDLGWEPELPTYDPERLDSLVARFEAHARRWPAGVDHAVHVDFGRHERHVAFGSLIHGDEVGSLPALVELLDALERGEVRYGGRITTFLGNLPAARANRRFLGADLNRVFLQVEGQTWEHERARALMPLLDRVDLFLDLHQTIEPTASAFAIFPWSEAGELWLRALQGAPAWVTRAPARAFVTGMRCADEYVRLDGRPGLTVELGQKGFSKDASALARRLLWRTLALNEGLVEEPGLLQREAGRLPECFTLEKAIPFVSPELALRPGLTNFRAVHAGELLSAPGSPEVKAPCDGVLLFPKYPPRGEDGRYLGPLPSELVWVLRPLGSPPAEAFGALPV